MKRPGNRSGTAAKIVWVSTTLHEAVEALRRFATQTAGQVAALLCERGFPGAVRIPRATATISACLGATWLAAIFDRMGLARGLLLWGARNRWLERQMRRRAFARRAVRRFMPGETLDAALHASRRTAGNGIGTVLTQLGENITTPEAATAVHDHYLEVLARIEEQALPAEISVKLTQLGLDGDPDAYLAHVLALAQRAAERGKRLWIDMEDSSYTDVTLELFRKVQSRFPRVGLCLQSYLRRTAVDLESLLPLNPLIRIVKGAYNEPPDRAFPKKRDVDASYEALAIRLIEHCANGGSPPVLGTHDTRLIEIIQQRATARGLAKNACEVHMLYGIRTAAQRRLAEQGYGVRVLISYGAAWFPWYMRRLAERPANIWFVIKSLVR